MQENLQSILKFSCSYYFLLRFFKGYFFFCETLNFYFPDNFYLKQLANPWWYRKQIHVYVINTTVKENRTLFLNSCYLNTLKNLFCFCAGFFKTKMTETSNSLNFQFTLYLFILLYSLFKILIFDRFVTYSKGSVWLVRH